jgi:hypothetical protein
MKKEMKKIEYRDLEDLKKDKKQQAIYQENMNFVSAIFSNAINKKITTIQ